MPPAPGTPQQRKSHRKFLNQRGFTYRCGRGSDAWSTDLVAHFDWWRHGRQGLQPQVDWDAIAPSGGQPHAPPKKRQKLIPSASSASSHSVSMSVIDRESKEVSQENTHTTVQKSKQIERTIVLGKDGVKTTRELETEITQEESFKQKMTAKIERVKELHIKEQMDMRTELVGRYATV
jgi:hypothetical protein